MPFQLQFATLMRKITLLLILFIWLSGLSVFGQKNPTKKLIKQTGSTALVETLEGQIGRIAQNYGIDARLFQALIHTESVFRIKAVSYKGAACYTQLMPGTARRFGLRVDSMVDERFNAEKCLTAGAHYLALLLKMFRGDVRLALAGYNAGEGAVLKYRNLIPPYKETVQYVEKICALYYGQSGHGVAMAYNQPLAQNWVNSMYAAQKPRFTSTASVRLASIKTALPARTIEADAPDIKAAEVKKVSPVTRVVTEKASPRIRTESLSFGNN